MSPAVVLLLVGAVFVTAFAMGFYVGSGRLVADEGDDRGADLGKGIAPAHTSAQRANPRRTGAWS